MTWNDASLRGLIEIGGIPQELRGLPALRHLWRGGGPAWLALLRHIPNPGDLVSLARRAADPNTPPEALVILAGIFPAEFCANPVLPLLLLEDPNLPATFDSAACGRLLSHPDVPPDFLAAFVHLGRAEDALAASLHVGLAGESADWRAELTAAVLQVPTIPDDDLLAVLTALGTVPNWLTPRIAAAENLRLAAALAAAAGDVDALRQLASTRAQAATANQHSVAELLLLLEDEDPAVRVIAAADPRTPPAALAAAKEREDWTEVDPRIYEALGGNPSSPPEVLLAIAADRSALLTNARRLTALNPSTPNAALTLLADEPYASDIRLILAAHPNLAPIDRAPLRRQSLAQALEISDPIYRAIALVQPDVDPGALMEHIHSPFWIERLAVALNPTTSHDSCAALAVDGNRLVRAAARERIPPHETARTG